MSDLIDISDDACIQAYSEFKNLKLAGDSIGMKWQTLYSRLKRCGVAVVGDKSRYGSLSDKIGARGESDFKRLVPKADNCNLREYQPRVDFKVGDLLVEVKASIKKSCSKITNSKRWAFSIKKQECVCDFFVFMAYSEDKASLEKVFLIPSELAVFSQSITVSATGKSKWHDFEVDSADLACFFDGYSKDGRGSE